MRPSLFPLAAAVCAAVFVPGVWAANICETWSSDSSYHAGDMALHDGHLWRAHLPAAVGTIDTISCDRSNRGEWAWVVSYSRHDLYYCSNSGWQRQTGASFSVKSKEPASNSPYWTQWIDAQMATLCQ